MDDNEGCIVLIAAAIIIGSIVGLSSCDSNESEPVQKEQEEKINPEAPKYKKKHVVCWSGGKEVYRSGKVRYQYNDLKLHILSEEKKVLATVPSGMCATMKTVPGVK